MKTIITIWAVLAVPNVFSIPLPGITDAVEIIGSSNESQAQTKSSPQTVQTIKDETTTLETVQGKKDMQLPPKTTTTVETSSGSEEPIVVGSNSLGSSVTVVKAESPLGSEGKKDQGSPPGEHQLAAQTASSPSVAKTDSSPSVAKTDSSSKRDENTPMADAKPLSAEKSNAESTVVSKSVSVDGGDIKLKTTSIPTSEGEKTEVQMPADVPSQSAPATTPSPAGKPSSETTHSLKTTTQSEGRKIETETTVKIPNPTTVPAQEKTQFKRAWFNYLYGWVPFLNSKRSDTGTIINESIPRKICNMLGVCKGWKSVRNKIWGLSTTDEDGVYTFKSWPRRAMEAIGFWNTKPEYVKKKVD